ncbi:radical SAM protein [Heliobacterium chlorum]|uniref:Radical SAM protein n=1 Tax=Heliobacterium chlorum TaxID=2698 RepID=A0ABR7T8Q5_HELCL|nr:4Fe-4S cluster-binding domain-containing protein [Heliobacterium chlorum]MBC9786400.1 radical SAM protein [Heliobacterium chlorum]
MIVGGFNDLNTSDAGGGIAYSVFFQGCSRGCPGCHNPELQDPDGGMDIESADILLRIQKYRNHYDAVVFVGGEPLEQPDALIHLLIGINEMGLESWLYTGFSYEDIPKEISRRCTVIVAGEYREKLHTGAFPASNNQIIIDNRRI